MQILIIVYLYIFYRYPGLYIVILQLSCARITLTSKNRTSFAFCL